MSDIPTAACAIVSPHVFLTGCQKVYSVGALRSGMICRRRDKHLLGSIASHPTPMERLLPQLRLESAYRTRRTFVRALGMTALLLYSGLAQAMDPDSEQAMEDAWWTGPILASSAATAPRGHFMIEPFLYDTIASGQFDRNGAHRTQSRTHSVRASGFIMYGVSDRLSVALVPSFGFNRASDGSVSTLGLGDLSLQTQYRLTDFEWGRAFPTTSILISATLPTGRYDRLGSHPEAGLGSGAYTETISVYSQYYFLMPTGRLLRTRLDVSFLVSDAVSLRDASVYGTPANFRGQAAPGDSFAAYLSGEYSVTRNWVVALEAAFQHSDTTVVTGDSFTSLGNATKALDYFTSLGSSRSTALAAELEYNWNEQIGIVGGAIVTVSGRNAAATITPALAVNINL